MSLPIINSLQDLKRHFAKFLSDTLNIRINPDTSTFSPPYPANDPENPLANTGVDISPIGILGYSNQDTITVLYTRINISPIISKQALSFLPIQQTLLSQIIPLLNAQYKLSLNEFDYLDVTLPPINSLDIYENRPASLVIKEDSYFYIGQYIINLNSSLSGTISGGIQLDPLGNMGPRGFQGPQGPRGLSGIHIGDTPPTDISLLWLDTSVE